MSLFRRTPPVEESREAGYIPGSVWSGAVTYTTDPHIGRPGYYALDSDAKTILEPHVWLTWIDDDPTDEENAGGHYVVADPDPDVPYFSHLPPSLRVNPVGLESAVSGSGQVNADA